MKNRFEVALSTILVACAIVTTGLVVRREFVIQHSGQAAVRKPVLIHDWQSLLASGVRLGPPNAPIQLMEFADFECPFCGNYHTTLKALRERYPAQVSLTFVHFPLPGHRFALPAARAAECAADQGKFEATYDRLFDEQSSFGIKTWGDYAAEAGVLDPTGFDRCVKGTASISRVEAGKELGARLDVKATPTLIVNGWMFGLPPTAQELDAMVKKILAGKSPVDQKL